MTEQGKEIREDSVSHKTLIRTKSSIPRKSARLRDKHLTKIESGSTRGEGTNNLELKNCATSEQMVLTGSVYSEDQHTSVSEACKEHAQVSPVTRSSQNKRNNQMTKKFNPDESKKGFMKNKCALAAREINMSTMQIYVPKQRYLPCQVCNRISTCYLLHRNHRAVHARYLHAQSLRYHFVLRQAVAFNRQKKTRTKARCYRKQLSQTWLKYCSSKLRQHSMMGIIAQRKKDMKNISRPVHSIIPLAETSQHAGVTGNVCPTTRGRKSSSKRCQKMSLSSSSQKLFQCSLCLRSVTSQLALHKHLQTIHGHTKEEADRLQEKLAVSLQCDESGCIFRSCDLQELAQHMDSEHPHVQFLCTQCPKFFSIRLQLQRHIHSSHSGSESKKHHCDHCGQSFSKPYTLHRHKYWKHGVENNKVKVYHCEMDGCGYKTSACSSIRAHRSKHSAEKLFTCQYCGLKLKTEVCYKKHVNKMHLGIRPYLCQVCGQNFGEEHELRSHITNKHTLDREYKCTLCPYNTAVKATFHTHLFNVHKVQADDDKRKIFKCPHCPYTSVLSHRYKTHLNGHTNTRTYACTCCDKTFISSATLRSHKKWIHSDQHLTCTLCDYQTKTQEKLNEHIRVQHQLKGVKPYKCPYCDFRCATGGNTRKHVKQIHRGEPVRYVRDDDMLLQARQARAAGNYSSICDNVQKQTAADVADSSET